MEPEQIAGAVRVRGHGEVRAHGHGEALVPLAAVRVLEVLDGELRVQMGAGADGRQVHKGVVGKCNLFNASSTTSQENIIDAVHHLLQCILLRTFLRLKISQTARA
jgi:hypothetical protein